MGVACLNEESFIKLTCSDCANTEAQSDLEPPSEAVHRCRKQATTAHRRRAAVS